jgi:hypothetical protein
VEVDSDLIQRLYEEILFLVSAINACPVLFGIRVGADDKDILLAIT